MMTSSTSSSTNFPSMTTRRILASILLGSMLCLKDGNFASAFTRTTTLLPTRPNSVGSAASSYYGNQHNFNSNINHRRGRNNILINNRESSSSANSRLIREGLRARVQVDAIVDPLENSTDRVGGMPQDGQQVPQQGKGLAPPFQVTLEGEDAQSYTRAIERTLAWAGASAAFGGALWFVYGSEVGEEFFAGYLLEQSLSVDNLFVFLLLFEYFKVPKQYQDRILNWGIYGAVVMRATMISLGAVALAEFHQILLVFAAILLFSSVSFFVGGDDDDDDEELSDNAIVKFSKSLINSTEKFDGDRFFTTMEDGVRKATPMLICTIAVEISDVVFAVDSIPAVFGVTENPLVVFSSNMFAILGLRSMYTILSKAASDLKYLEPAVAVVLGFIGGKMVAEYFGYHVPTEVALGVVGTLLVSGIGASVLEKGSDETESVES